MKSKLPLRWCVGASCVRKDTAEGDKRTDSVKYKVILAKKRVVTVKRIRVKTLNWVLTPDTPYQKF